MEAANPKVTDAIPRATLEQIFVALRFLATKERSTFEEIRSLLQRETSRRAPASPEAMWTTTRDALAELQRLSLSTSGPLPRKRSEVERLRESPCQLTAEGLELVARYNERKSHGFDHLLLRWVNEHPYFRAYLTRLAEHPMHVPDVTSIKQIGELDAASGDELALRVIKSCAERLRSVGWTEERLDVLGREIKDRMSATIERLDRNTLRGNTKAWVDLVEDSIVLPSFLAAEQLQFDPVTFQHITKIAQEFLAAAWTSSPPGFEGRVIFSTCDFTPSLTSDETSSGIVREVSHRGRSWASGRFDVALTRAYVLLSDGRSGTYADVYSLRALVCTELGIQPKVFERCLNEIARSPQPNRPVIYTELPMRPPPSGENYVAFGDHRIGSVKLVLPTA